jgi:hypothetical protein
MRHNEQASSTKWMLGWREGIAKNNAALESEPSPRGKEREQLRQGEMGSILDVLALECLRGIHKETQGKQEHGWVQSRGTVCVSWRERQWKLFVYLWSSMSAQCGFGVCVGYGELGLRSHMLPSGQIREKLKIGHWCW